MRPARGLLVLAIVAALWGAPSPVSGAVNELSSPQVSPPTGSVTTVFTFRVRYDGGFPARSVSVAVAGLSLPMALESGSPTSGWWTASSLLPIGAWSTSFEALAPQGPSPTLAGPSVTVAGLATPYPTASGPSAPGGAQTPAPSAAPAPAPAEAAASGAATTTPAPDASDPNLAPGAGDGAAGPSAGATMSTPPPAGAGGGAGGVAGGLGGGTSDAGGGGAGGASDGGGEGEPAGDGAPVASPATEPNASGGRAPIQPASDTDASDDRASTDAAVSAILAIGLAGVASVAIIGTLLLLALRRRNPRHATVTTAPSVTDGAVLRRVARSGGTRAAEDPIVAALGVDDEMAARRAIRRAARRQDEDAGAPGRLPKGR